MTRFFESIAHNRPTVVVIEDLHWASQPTLEFVSHFVRHATGAPLLLVGTARPEFLEANRALVDQLTELTLVDLKALNAGESSRLALALLPADDVPGLADRVAGQCGGNPLFAEELAHFLSEAPGGHVADAAAGAADIMPASIVSLVAARLDALPTEQKQLLTNASVVGEVFWPKAVAAVSMRPPDDVRAGLARLEEREFVRRLDESSLEGDVGMAFWHALVRDVAYEQLPRPSRSLRHIRAARWLEGRTRDSEDLAELVAHHYATGLEVATAAHQVELIDETRSAARTAFVRAGDHALRLDLAAAERHYHHALMTLDNDDPLVPELLLKRGGALMVVGRLDEAAKVQSEAVDMFGASGNTRRHALALSRLAFTLSKTRVDESRSLAEQALAMLTSDGPSEESIAALETWTTLRLWQGNLTEVLDATARTLRMAQRLGDQRPPRALSIHGYARYLLGERQGLDEMLEGIAIAERHGSGHELSGLRDAYARCLCVAEDPAKALCLVDEWIADARRRHDQGYVIDLSIMAARYLLLCGRWADAADAAGELLEESRHRETPSTEAELLAVLVAAHLGSGAVDEAGSALDRLEQLQPELQEERLNLGSVAGAGSAAALGDSGRGVWHLEQALSDAGFTNEPTDVLWWPLGVRVALALHRADLADALVEQALAWAPCPERVRLTLAALLAENRADNAAAATDYAAAAAAWEAGCAPHEAGLALLGAGRCQLSLGKVSDALAALSRARVILEGIGSRLALADVDRVFQSIRTA